MKTKLLRDFGIAIGTLPTGPLNSITDVEGVMVGHATIIEGEGPLTPGEGPVRTGVTVVMPNAGNIFQERVMGSGFVLNGAGELSGLTQVMEWGVLETPIALTNTHAVGVCSDALVQYMVDNHVGIGQEHDVVIPLVGECDDSWLNDVTGRHVKQKHVLAAIDDATSGEFAQGSVGGGTGMITCDLKAGIGTSSRVLEMQDRKFTVGVLVMSNFGTLEQLRIDGFPAGRVLRDYVDEHEIRRENYGSIIALVATDAPLRPTQLGRIAKRASLGIGRVGSTANHGSGEIILAFTTANRVPRSSSSLTHNYEVLADKFINPVYQATVDATEEAILNALCAADTMTGRDGHTALGLPMEEIVDRVIWTRDV